MRWSIPVPSLFSVRLIINSFANTKILNIIYPDVFLLYSHMGVGVLVILIAI